MQHLEGEETAFKLATKPARPPEIKDRNLMKVYLADKQFWLEDFRANIFIPPQM